MSGRGSPADTDPGLEGAGASVTATERPGPPPVSRARSAPSTLGDPRGRMEPTIPGGTLNQGRDGIR